MPTLYPPFNAPFLDAVGHLTPPWVDFFSRLQAAMPASGAAPSDAQYLVGAADPTLTAERVATDTATIDVDLATAGQAKWHVFDDAITFAKMQNIPASTLIGRGSAAGTGDPESITLGAGLSMTSTVLSASGGGAGGSGVGLMGLDGAEGEQGPMGPPGPPGTFSGNVEDEGYWSPLTNGDVINPEVVFELGDTVSVWTPLS